MPNINIQMKKLALLGSSITLFFAPVVAFAEDINITAPTVGGIAGGKTLGYSKIGEFISNVLSLAFALAVLTVLIMLVWGAFEWITSGGDKETVGKARGRIINALIGMAVLAVAFALATVAAQFLGFENLQKITIPAPK